MCVWWRCACQRLSFGPAFGVALFPLEGISNEPGALCWVKLTQGVMLLGCAMLGCAVLTAWFTVNRRAAARATHKSKRASYVWICDVRRLTATCCMSDCCTLVL